MFISEWYNYAQYSPPSRDEDSIDYNLTCTQTGADNDWRWQEQWLTSGTCSQCLP
jgi:hypothetical protein